MEWENSQLQEILDLEWEMFTQAQNVGGPAPCQSDREGFCLHRGSQFAAWDEATRTSYLADLHRAGEAGRNLVAEKYGYMMEFTVPEEYERIRGLLPALDFDTRSLVDEIAAIETRWAREAAQQYPHLLSRGRSLDSVQDSPDNTSVETYLRGELATYSPRTLVLYRAHLAGLQANGGNLNLTVLEHTLRALGYASLEAEEEAVARRDRP